MSDANTTQIEAEPYPPERAAQFEAMLERGGNRPDAFKCRCDRCTYSRMKRGAAA